MRARRVPFVTSRKMKIVDRPFNKDAIEVIVRHLERTFSQDVLCKKPVWPMDVSDGAVCAGNLESEIHWTLELYLEYEV